MQHAHPLALEHKNMAYAHYTEFLENVLVQKNYCIFQGYIQGGPQKCPYLSLEITFTKIRKPSKFFLHRYWKFIEFFWCKPV